MVLSSPQLLFQGSVHWAGEKHKKTDGIRCWIQFQTDIYNPALIGLKTLLNLEFLIHSYDHSPIETASLLTVLLRLADGRMNNTSNLPQTASELFCIQFKFEQHHAKCQTYRGCHFPFLIMTPSDPQQWDLSFFSWEGPVPLEVLRGRLVRKYKSTICDVASLMY